MRALVRAAAAILLLAAAGVVAGCSDDQGPEGELVIATGGQGGVYYAYGQGLADAVRSELPRLRPKVLATAASVDNLRMVGSGEADVAFTLADSAALASSGASPFPEPQPVRALARLYENYVHLAVRADSPIRSLPQLKARVVSVGAAGSGTELLAARLLTVAGVDPERAITQQQLGVAESAAALREKKIEAFFFSGGLPTAAITDLARAESIRLIELAAYVPAMRARFGEFYAERSIPASTYGVAETATVGVPNYLVVGSDMDAEVAYRLTRLLFTEREALARVHPVARRLNERAAYATYPIALHPGAARFYRESKG